MIHEVYLSLGTNMGDKPGNLKSAIALLEGECGDVIKFSPIYKTQPWGFESQNEFLNQCILFKSKLAADKLLERILLIEQIIGRVREVQHYADRPIDIDILFYDKEIIETNSLTIPHPGIPKRKFVLLPLKELAPDFIHPVLNITVAEMAEICDDQGIVKRLPDK